MIQLHLTFFYFLFFRLRIVWKIELVERFLFHPFEEFDRVFFELSGTPVYYSKAGDYSTYCSAKNGDYGEDKGWSRFDSKCFFHQGQYYTIDSQAIGCSTTICVDFCRKQTSNVNIYDMLFILIDKLWWYNKRTINTFASKVDIVYETLKPSFVPVLLDSYNLKFDIHYACLTLFTSNLKCLDLMVSDGLIEEFFCTLIVIIGKERCHWRKANQCLHLWSLFQDHDSIFDWYSKRRSKSFR